jgi:steroid delta-isomerase-like uncharacterized protein
MASSVQEQNKQLVLQLFEAGDRHDMERMEQLVSTTNYTLHFSGMPTTMDWNGHKQFLAAINSAFADVHHDLGDILAEGEDKVAVRWNNITATHIGEFQGIPPSDKRVSFSAMHFLTIKDGKIVEHWINADMMGLMQQIGAIPTTSHATGGNSTTRS